MLDASRDLSQRKSKVLFWKITGNTLCEYTDPIFMEMKSCVDFNLEKRIMRTSKEAGYQIEKLTTDSLIITQRLDGEEAPDKIRKMWFVNNSVRINNFLNKHKNDTIITAIKDFTPSLERNLFSEIADIYAKREYSHDFSLNGNILIFPKKKIIRVEINNEEGMKKNDVSVGLFKSTLEKNYYLWNLSGFENFEKVIIPYNYSTKVTNGRGEISRMGITFFDRNYVDAVSEFIVYVKDKKKSLQSFSKALQAMNNNNLDKAIEFFDEAHENDNTNTDALYNIVSISIAQNKTDVACTALKKLKDLEQTEGTRLYNEKCSGK
jgi:tetratricopeptide (TPR) repeat protein